MFHNVKHKLVNHGSRGFGINQIFHVGHSPVKIFRRDHSIFITIGIFEEFSNNFFGVSITFGTSSSGFGFNVLENVSISEFSEGKEGFFFTIFFIFDGILSKNHFGILFGDPFRGFNTSGKTFPINFSCFEFGGGISFSGFSRQFPESFKSSFSISFERG